MQGAAFGRYATPEGRAYIKRRIPYSQKATDAVMDGYLAGIAPNATLDAYNTFKAIDNAKTVEQLQQAMGQVDAPVGSRCFAHTKSH